MTAYHLRRDALKIAEHFPGSECSIHQAIDMLLDQDASRLSGRPQGRDKDEEEENAPPPHHPPNSVAIASSTMAT